MDFEEAKRIIWDCIVIGSGPAGSHLAYLLADKGHKVLVLEKNNMAGQKKACGGAIPNFLANKLSINSVIRSECKDIEIIFGNKRSKLKSEAPFILMIKRSELDNFLINKAKEKGATVLNCVYAVDIDKDAEVLCRQVGANELFKMRGKYLVLADGAMTLGSKVGIGFCYEKQDNIKAIKYDIKSDNYSMGAKFIIDIEIMNPGYCWVFGKRDILNVGIGGFPCNSATSFYKMMEIFIKRYLGGIEISVVNSKGGVVPLQTAKKFACSKIVVVGDAAGLVNPMTGGGIHYAIKSAEVAARLINKKLKMGASEDLDIFNLKIKLNLYYLWLKIMRLIFLIFRRLRKYNGLLYYYFLIIYFRFFLISERLIKMQFR